MYSSKKFALFSILMIAISLPSMILCQFEEQFQNNPFIKFTKELGSAQKAKQFLKITTNSSLTNAELAQKLEEFARENGVITALRKLNETANRMKDQIVDAAPQNLAGPALQTFNQIIGILSDESQTRGEACDQVRSVLNGTDPVVRHFLPKGLGISCLGVGNDPRWRIKSRHELEEANLTWRKYLQILRHY